MMFIYTTFPDRREANKIAKLLIEEKLAACVNVWPISSVYRWQNKIVQEKEQAVLIKTKARKFRQVERFLLAHHPYQTPAIIAWRPEKVSKRYERWLSGCLNS